MIIRKKEHWFKMLFIWQGSVLPTVLPRLILLLILSIAVVWFRGTIFSFKVPLNPTPLTLFGFVLALFLGFRNSVSYDRFWEGRKLWGALLIDTRSLARQALTLPNSTSDDNQTNFIQLLISLSYALKHQLRGTEPEQDLKSRLNEKHFNTIASAKFKPVALIKLMADWVKNAKQNNQIDSILQARFDENLDKLSDIVGGCERIVSTPIPYSYSVLLHRTVYLYCFLLPFGLVDSLQWLTPLIVVFIAYTFVAFEAIADEIEQPFGTEANALALNAICLTIETSLLEMVGKELPEHVRENKVIVD